MEWFNTEIEGVIYSDKTLDLAYDFLKKFSETYQSNLKRKPTIQELEFLLKQVFSWNADNEILDNFEKKEIIDIKIKINKKKKTQVCEVGDIFTIPLFSGGYGFGRIIYMDERNWGVGEIFSFFSEYKKYTPEIELSGHLMYPRIILKNHFSNWVYTIIHKDKNYICPYLDELRYVSGSPGNYWVDKIGDYGGKGPAVTDEEANRMHKYILLHQDTERKMIEDTLRERKLLPN
ncbi:hypothetical protein F7767_11430 [Salmonella enterica subsp. enterica serovar Infantis]|nr:hypothetical protein [Salmonella enterica subsp. enterica serovar Infantis]